MEYFTLNISKVGLDTSLNSWFRGATFIIKEKKKKRKEKEEKRERRKRRADFSSGFRSSKALFRL